MTMREEEREEEGGVDSVGPGAGARTHARLGVSVGAGNGVNRRYLRQAALKMKPCLIARAD